MRAALTLVWSGLSVAACYSPEPPLGVPCAQNGDCPRGQECDLITNVCGFPTENRTLRDDTAEDFAGGVHAGTFVEPGGFVGPIPYFANGVRTTGIAGNQLAASSAAITFDELAALPVAGRGVLRTARLDFGLDDPYLLGISGIDGTVLVEGEVYLDATGDYGFEVRGNDLGFVDIAPPGSATFTRVATSVANTATVGTYTVAAPGWYRFRGAFANADMYMQWELRYDPPGNASLRTIPVDKLRAPVDGLAGLALDGFDDPNVVYYQNTALSAELFEQQYTSDPYGIPIGNATFTLRWAGQMLIDSGGTYEVGLATSTGQRLWIDGKVVFADVDGAAHDTKAMLPLEAGWHDVIIEVHKFAISTVAVSFTRSGPDGTGAVPADHLRPAEGRIGRFASGRNDTELAIPDGMAATRTIGLALPGALDPTRIDVGFHVTHAMPTTVSVVLDPPAGANLTLAPEGSITDATDALVHVTVPTDRSGTPFAFVATDSTADAMVGTLDSASATITYDGGVPPFDLATTFISAPREIAAVRLGAIRWAMRQEIAPTAVSVRTCDDAAACDAEPWTAVAQGEMLSVPARKYLQYKLDLTSDGDTASSLDWIEVDYVGTVER